MTDLGGLVDRYRQLFPDEESSLVQLSEFLSYCSDGDKRVDRRNFDGHVTASALIVDPVARRILLLYHPRYRLTLQPGGHFSGVTESPLEVATRKVHSETPYGPADVRYLPYDYELLVPIDIDSHRIPADEAAAEVPHVHHDFRYVFLSRDRRGIGDAAAGAELTAQKYTYLWYSFEDLQRFKSFARLYRKLQQFLSRDSARRRFYVGLSDRVRHPRSTNTIAVTHVLPDAYEFIEALSRSTNLLAVIPKPKSLHEPTRARLEANGIRVLPLARDEMPKRIDDLLSTCGEASTVLLDIGGWFVPVIAELSPDGARCIVGVVEDTKNGQDKYVAYARANLLPFPIISVAESALKANEDFLVGQSVVFSADAILRTCGLLLEYLDCGVIGYGKIGKSIAHHLRLRGLKPFVVEERPLRRLEAYNALCAIRDRAWVNQNVDVIFCATGSRGTAIVDFRTLRPGAFVFSVTSSDDEFNLNLLKGEYTSSTVAPHVTRYDSDHNHFYLVNHGNAVNFLHDAVLWEFIQLVRGGILVGARNLVDGVHGEQLRLGSEDSNVRNLFGLTEADQEAIAKLWMDTVLLGVKLNGG